MTLSPRYLTAQDVCAYIRCSRNQIDVLVRAGRLPQPIRLTDRMVRWDREAIDAMLGSGANDAPSVDEIFSRPPDAFSAAKGRARRQEASRRR
jgi:prophage regulatory protein